MMFVSEIRAQYIDENDLFRTVLKRIYEDWDAARNQWHLKKIEYIFCEPEYPVLSEPVNVAVETRHGWLIPPDWEFDTEVWVYTRKEVTSDQLREKCNCYGCLLTGNYSK